MIKLGGNEYIVYNKDGIMVLVTAKNKTAEQTVEKEKGLVDKNNRIDCSIRYRLLKNDKNMSNEYILKNANKKLSEKDKQKLDKLNEQNYLGKFYSIAGEICKDYRGYAHLNVCKLIWGVIEKNIKNISAYDKNNFEEHPFTNFIFCNMDEFKNILEDFDKLETNKQIIKNNDNEL